MIPHVDTIPKQLYWGAFVTPTIVYGRINISYSAETRTDTSSTLAVSLAAMRELAETTSKYHSANILQYEQLLRDTFEGSLSAEVRKGLDIEGAGYQYYIWSDGEFVRLSDAERLSFSGDEVWRPIEYSQWKNGTRATYNDANWEQYKRSFYTMLASVVNEQAVN